VRQILVVASFTLLVACGGTPPRTVSLPREPFLGLRCPAETYPCRRIGLAVWVAHPAESVRARVDGHSVTLQTGPGSGAYADRLFWQGTFRDRRAEELADDFPQRLHVELSVFTPDGRHLEAQADPVVSAGYG
jgi:hypothetical protein